MLKKKKSKILLLSSVLVFGIFLFNFITINRKYPDREIQTYTLGDKVEYSDCTITITGYRLFTKDEFLDKYSILSDSEDIGCEWNKLLIDLTIENKLDSKNYFETDNLLLESGSWWNGLDMQTMKSINETLENSTILLQARQKVFLCLPYTLYEIQFKPMDWNSIENREFDLIASIYPITQKIILN